jgi:UDP-glucose:glycoprotein glucosyltransferase
LFWKFVENIGDWDHTKHDYKANVELATKKASAILSPLGSRLLTLSISLRSYSPTVEMYRQLAASSGSSCGGEGGAVVDGSVACSAEELEKLLAGSKADAQKAHVHEFDHIYPAAAATPLAAGAPSVVHYGVMGSAKFQSFHKILVAKAKKGEVQYVLRHCPPLTGTKMPLQGWGASLDIKNMEYKTLDDSMKGEDSEAAEGDKEEEEDVIDGFIFSKLAEWKSTDPAYKDHLAQFKKALIDGACFHARLKVLEK